MTGIEISSSSRRQRSLSTSMSYSSSSERGGRKRPHHRGKDFGDSHGRSGRRKDGRTSAYGEQSPPTRDILSARKVQNRDRSGSGGKGKRRRHASRSPGDRGRGRDNYDKKASRATHSPTGSRDRSRTARYRKSMTPGLGPYADERENDYRSDRKPISYDGGRTSRGNESRRLSENQPPPRQRSLSPFSKRAALTREMNFGR